MRRLILVIALAVSCYAQQPVEFHIQPVHPVEQLRRKALATEPPMQIGDFYKPVLVELVKLDPTFKLDIRYATTNNFLSTPMYEEARAFLQKPAAEALVRVSNELHAKGLGLLIHDGYRPWYVTKMFWDATPADKHQFVADPSQGSHHNRGCAVDLTLYDLKTGKELPMPSAYDEMSERAYPNYKGGTEEERHNRETLREAMERQGFTVYEYEWWHYDYKDWKHYPVLNVQFSQIPDPDFSAKLLAAGSSDKPAKPVFTPDPEYSEEARRAGVNAKVESWVFIGSDGLVKQVIVFKPAGYGLDEQSIRALEKWKFNPATRNGAPVPAEVSVETMFHLYHGPRHRSID
jgi:D-alanyl-D-alanine dipeptidase